MANNIAPEIKKMSFQPLSKSLLEGVLKRTLEYDCTDNVLAARAWRVVSGVMLDYRKAMQAIASLLTSEGWDVLSTEPSNNGVPVLVLQKGRANVLIAGASAGELGMVVLLGTAGSKPDT
ncbi:MAG: hypothetical protein JW839_16275, partial [Candidatus Lokiarchaeota archaeon]|nr:hypothetical protein [Candidatus Lokiarchaeota archaeon]